MRVWAGLAIVGVVLITGCKGAAPPAAAKEAAAGKAIEMAVKTAPLDPATLGDVSGVVRFAGKAPEPVRIDTSMDPACGIAPGAQQDAFSEQYAVKNERLANVYIYVKNGPAAAMTTGISGQAPVVLDQKGCVYTPHVIAVQVGGQVEFRNDDPTMHNVHTMPTSEGNAAIDISQGPRGKPQVKVFKQPEVMMPVRCNNHPWMNAFINVSQTPWFAVTGADGKFDLKGLPAGEYTLAAVQEKMGEQTLPVKVAAKGEARADFTFALKK